MLALLLACGGSQKPEPAGTPIASPEPAPAPAVPAPLTSKPIVSRAAVSRAYGAHATDFAMRFHSELADGNTATSGTSAQLALSMLAAGAAGETLSEFDTLFGAEADQPWHVDQQRAMAAFNDTPGIELSVVNGLWTQTGFPLTEAYLEKMRAEYLANPSELDFAGDASGAAGTINAWTKENTDGMIEKLVEVGDVQGAKLVLANAIAFKGTWASAFDPEMTRGMPFRTPDGSVDVPTMNQKIEGMSYVEAEGFRGIALPYEGRRAMMLIVLPDEGVDLATVEATLDDKMLGRLTMSGRRPVNVSLPKWRIEATYDLEEPLKAMGLVTAFSGGDFSGMSSQGLSIDAAIQKVFVEVDEQGTKAAAVTGVIMKTTAMPPPPVDFVVDRPFFWALWHVETGSPLFTGRVVDPR